MLGRVKNSQNGFEREQESSNFEHGGMEWSGGRVETG